MAGWPGWGVSVSSSPGESIMPPALTVPSRIFGPCKSPRMASDLPSSRATSRIICTVWVWVAWSPWEKLTRATVMPAASIRRMVSLWADPGPMVATILVRAIA